MHVWKASVAGLSRCAPAFHDLLDADERERSGRFHHEADRLRHVVSHGLLRTLVGLYLDRPAASLRFAAGQYGKPHLTGVDAGRLAHSLSHSGDLVLIAVARRGNVGVDVEHWAPRLAGSDLDRLAASVFSAHECAALRGLDAEAHRAAFYAVWTRKEAYLKATGTGIARGLAHFDVSGERDAARLLADRLRAGAAERWTLHDVVPAAGYSGAVAFDTGASTLALLTAEAGLLEHSGVAGQ